LPLLKIKFSSSWVNKILSHKKTPVLTLPGFYNFPEGEQHLPKTMKGTLGNYFYLFHAHFYAMQHAEHECKWRINTPAIHARYWAHLLQ